MGIWGLFRRSERAKQADAAADQIYGALCSGCKIELPQSFSTDDPTAQAILRVRQKYPDSTVTMLQNNTLVLTRGNAGKAAVSSQAWNILDAHGYFPDNRMPSEMLFDAHGRFMHRNDNTVDNARAKADDALKQDKAASAIVLG